jgi:hypothetical protein
MLRCDVSWHVDLVDDLELVSFILIKSATLLHYLLVNRKGRSLGLDEFILFDAYKYIYICVCVL